VEEVPADHELGTGPEIVDEERVHDAVEAGVELPPVLAVPGRQSVVGARGDELGTRTPVEDRQRRDPVGARGPEPQVEVRALGARSRREGGEGDQDARRREELHGDAVLWGGSTPGRGLGEGRAAAHPSLESALLGRTFHCT
jgi:hypothetical protein